MMRQLEHQLQIRLIAPLRARAEAVRARMLPGQRGEYGWGPFWTLLYLGFLFINWKQAPLMTWLAPTLLSLAIFLPLYFAAYRCSNHKRVMFAYLAAIAVLGYTLTPLNTGANVYLIYAAAPLPYSGLDLRRSLATIAVGLLVYLGEMLMLGWPGQAIAIAVGITAIIATAVCVANHSGRERNLRQADLKLSHDEVRRLAATAERERIGRDLHDLLGHTLSLITLKLELSGKLFDRDPKAARREMKEAENVARHALGEVRAAVSGIRAADLVAELASVRLLLGSAGVHLDLTSTDAPLPGETECTLALIVREAATNIARHARASQARIEFSLGPGEVQLRIADDGRGGAAETGNGLKGMRERVQALGGKFAVDSSRGHGTVLTVSLPLPLKAETGNTHSEAAAPEAPMIDHGTRSYA